MNKWEDSFKKISVEKDGTQLCHCSDNQGLFIPNRQLSAVVAIILLLSFSIFMTGYFLGKRKVVEQFTQEVQQDAVSDKIYTTMLATQEGQSSFVKDSAYAETTRDKSVDMRVAADALLVTHVDDNITASPLMSHEEISTTVQLDATSQDARSYYAQLIGFGTEKAAQLFAKKLLTKGIETEVKRRSSKTAKGHTSYWYQVVTAQYSNKDDLLHLVDRLTKEENIKDARICTC